VAAAAPNSSSFLCNRHSAEALEKGSRQRWIGAEPETLGGQLWGEGTIEPPILWSLNSKLVRSSKVAQAGGFPA
jgi:hypothetical protein